MALTAMQAPWRAHYDAGVPRAIGHVPGPDARRRLRRPRAHAPRRDLAHLQGPGRLPDERKGEIVVAWIVPRAGVTLPPEQDLRAYCRERLAPYKVPARIEVRDQLPKTLVGKVLRRALVASASTGAAVR